MILHYKNVIRTHHGCESAWSLYITINLRDKYNLKEETACDPCVNLSLRGPGNAPVRH